MKRTYLLNLSLILILVGAIVAYFSLSKTQQLTTLQVGNARLDVEIADTSEKITIGLSNRDKLPENQGMYFVLGKREVSVFWMKEMRFQIDIIWIDGDKIVGIEKNAPTPAGSVIATFTSPSAVTNVLEVNAGYSTAHNLKAHDKVELLR